MTTNTRKFIVALFVIALFAIMLSACSPAQLVASAYSGSDPATGISVNMSPRIKPCDASSRQQILNKANALPADSGYTVDSFLDEYAATFTCIAAK